MNEIRQGEILLIQVSEIPSHYQLTKANRMLLAIGETGNAHVLVAEQTEWLHDAVENINDINRRGAAAAQSDLFVRIASDGIIEHSDRKGHTEAPVPAGDYLVRIKREQMPWENKARYISD